MSYSTEETIILTINQDGSKIKMDAEGFSGGECSVVLHKVTEMLGKMTSFDKKAEYYEQDVDQEVIITTR